MSDLADIAAAAGIAIIDTTLSDGGDMGHSGDSIAKTASVASSALPDGSGDTAVTLEQDALESLFGYRYTEEDQDYAKTVTESETHSHPPCVEGYFGRRQRDRGSWHRNQNYRDHHRDGRGYRGRGDYDGNWNQRHGNDRGRDRSGDYRNRDRYQRDRSLR